MEVFTLKYDFKKLMDAGEVGGTALMGISKPVIKAHGNSDANAIKNAVRQALGYASCGAIEQIASSKDKFNEAVKAVEEAKKAEQTEEK